MGMYTELSFCAKLKKDTPAEVIENLKHLTGQIEERGEIPVPDHPFFKTDRTWLLTSGGSAYFPGVMTPVFEQDEYDKKWLLITKSNIKNYSEEIEKFLDWLKPHIDQGVGERDMFAVTCYEEQDIPTMHYLRG